MSKIISLGAERQRIENEKNIQNSKMHNYKLKAVIDLYVEKHKDRSLKTYFESTPPGIGKAEAIEILDRILTEISKEINVLNITDDYEVTEYLTVFYYEGRDKRDIKFICSPEMPMQKIADCIFLIYSAFFSKE